MAHNSVDYFYYLDHLPRYSVPSYHPILWGQVCLLKLSLTIEESVGYARRRRGKGQGGGGANNDGRCHPQAWIEANIPRALLA